MKYIDQKISYKKTFLLALPLLVLSSVFFLKGSNPPIFFYLLPVAGIGVLLKVKPFYWLALACYAFSSLALLAVFLFGIAMSTYGGGSESFDKSKIILFIFSEPWINLFWAYSIICFISLYKHLATITPTIKH